MNRNIRWYLSNRKGRPGNAGYKAIAAVNEVSVDVFAALINDIQTIATLIRGDAGRPPVRPLGILSGGSERSGCRVYPIAADFPPALVGRIKELSGRQLGGSGYGKD
jgi:hypothetical protein